MLQSTVQCNLTADCRWGGVCLMTGNYRDPANHAGFPSCELRPGQLYTHRAQYRFT